jgi:anti-sigma factor RsiW
MSDSTPITCEEALRLLAEYLDGELLGADHANVEQHLQRCRSCFSRVEFEEQLRTKLAALSEGSVTGAFEERIRSLIDRFSA